MRLGVEAPKTVKVYRQEVFDAIKAENEAELASAPVFPEFDFGSGRKALEERPQVSRR